MDSLTSNRLAVLGSPIKHSRSPMLHRAAYRQLGLDWTYEAVEVKSGSLAMFLSKLGREWRGLSLTMPLKQEVLPFIDDCDRVAQLTGAVNTVLLRKVNGRSTLSGYNTDVAGLVRALAEGGVTRAAHVTLLGAGATAASALMAAAELGTEFVAVLVRDPQKALPLVELGRSLGVVVDLQDLSGATRVDSDVVISTLPGGTLLSAPLPLALREQAILFDVAYSPWPSGVATSWQEAGGTVLNGLGMLLHQALIQVRVFVTADPFEPLPDESAVLAAMRGALTRDSGPGDAAPLTAVER
ncbi:shikimate dehydrogenase [Cryobacterium sp. TMT1-3]|uniref:Shikimate dehydrogenase n=1 Tax=Cryobacterium luteum TaxID=1424661 RepID=A0A1H8CXA2_9MICO|nr:MULTISPECIES: shikimate dehydrogenase [Cryobacterium]TFB91816.1 shikimate dehydrogenase [Cryobacterium luteum]TFC31210.1 shikimate dehydrogenase [Cryobacterium sp. TMT1-3]SEM99630.1 shikimate dehydrogenase [Cryobacterium luteum]